MENKDLQIGNFVLNYLKEPILVESIICDFNECTINSDIVELFDPIPLSKEWLLKLGFVKKHNDNELYHEFLIYFIGSNRFWFLDKEDGIVKNHLMIPKKLKYVHQLQNIITLMS